MNFQSIWKGFGKDKTSQTGGTGLMDGRKNIARERQAFTLSGYRHLKIGSVNIVLSILNYVSLIFNKSVTIVMNIE